MGKLQKSHFSTHRLHPTERLPAWCESIGTVFDIHAPAGLPHEAFNASLNSYLIDDQLMLARCETSAQRFERNPLRVARDSLDHYLVQTHLRGSQDLRRAGKQQRSEAGDLQVIDLADTHQAQTTDFCNLTLVIPRQMLAPHLIHPDSQQGRVLKGDKGLTRLAVNHIRMLLEVMDTLSDAEAVQSIEPMMMLLASALNGSSESVDGGEAGVAMSLLGQAKLEIERNLHRNLPVEELCAALPVSRATLYRLFEPFGGVRAYMQDRRLRRCAHALLAPHYAHRRIYEIAYAWGFASEAHFSRAFRRKFGISPREARGAFDGLPSKQIAAPARLIGDRHYEQWLQQILKG